MMLSDKIQEQFETDRKAMGSMMAFDSVIGIHVNEFANVFDEKVAIFVHTIDYFIEAVDHFRDYFCRQLALVISQESPACQPRDFLPFSRKPCISMAPTVSTDTAPNSTSIASPNCL